MRRLRGQWLFTILVLATLLTLILSTACVQDKEKVKATKPASEVTSEPVIEQYYIFGGPLSSDRYISLRTVGFWEGEGDKIIEFSLDKSPAVLNLAYTPTSAIAYGFDYGLQGRGYSDLGSKFWSKNMGPTKKSGNTYHMSEVVEGIGKFRLKITSSGAHWYVRLGVE